MKQGQQHARLRAEGASTEVTRGITGNTSVLYSFATGRQDHVYRVSQEERTKLRESVPYVKLYRYNPKHLYPKLNGYGDNGQRKVWTSCISA